MTIHPRYFQVAGQTWDCSCNKSHQGIPTDLCWGGELQPTGQKAESTTSKRLDTTNTYNNDRETEFLQPY